MLSVLVVLAAGLAQVGPVGATGTATVSISTPAPYASLPSGPMQVSGNATDTVGVKNVAVTITNTDLSKSYNYLATLAAPNAATTTWSLTWQPPLPGSYGISATAAGASGAKSSTVKVFADVAASSGTAYLSLVMSRAQLALADSNCNPLPGTVPLDEVASTLQSKSIPISGSVVTSYIADDAPSCVAHGPVNDLYPTWTQLGQLRDNNGMMFTSAGINYVDDTTLPTSQALANICGSLIPLAAHGDTRAWALYSYPNNHYTSVLQSQITQTCFAYGRTYASARAHTSYLNTAPHYQKTFSILGGACSDPAQPCYNLQVIGSVTGKQTFYTSVDQLGRFMQSGAGEWSVVQMYKFVTGSYNTGASSGLTWDCTSPDWHDHYVSDTESYCWNDFLAAVATVPSTVTIAQPDTVARAVTPQPNPPTTTITSPPPTPNSTSVSFSFASSDPRSWFSCSLDGAQATACVSPASFSGIGSGGHTFAVQAIAALGVNGTTATSSWAVGPGTTITGTPQNPTDAGSATFRFSSTDPQATFDCSLDGGAPAACASPVSYSGVVPGYHVLAVEGVDQGAVGPPTRYSWLINGASSGVLKPWALQSENFNSNHQPVPPDQALADASNFDVIIAHPVAYEASVPAMRAVNPHLTLLSYQNAVFAQPDQGSAFPASWYEYDIHGNPVRNKVSGNYLMNPTVSGWTSYEATQCQQNISASAYDGCYLDLLGLIPLSTGFVTGSPVDPSTRKAWTKGAWLAATTAMAQQVAQAISPTSLYGNGLGGGPLYYGVPPTSQLMQGLSGGVAEAWLRAAPVPDTQYPTDAQWLQDVSMMTDIQGHGKPMMGLVKVWGSGGTQQTVMAWQQFALATFLTGANGQSSFTFSGAPGTPRTTAFPVYQTQLGEPLGPYSKVNGIYQRLFANGLVLLNTSSPATTVTLGGRYFEGNGTPVTSVRLNPDTSVILTADVPPRVTPGSIQGPTNPTNNTSATFSFSSTAPSAPFWCSLDGSEPTACQPGVSYSNLANGAHIFAVQAVDENGVAGPQATTTWVIGPPVVTIVDGPAGTTSSTTATFDFASSEPSTFTCSLDGQTPAACTSPVTYSSFPSGDHTVTVTATSVTATSSASASWTVA